MNKDFRYQLLQKGTGLHDGKFVIIKGTLVKCGQCGKKYNFPENVVSKRKECYYCKSSKLIISPIANSKTEIGNRKSEIENRKSENLSEKEKIKKEIVKRHASKGVTIKEKSEIVNGHASKGVSDKLSEKEIPISDKLSEKELETEMKLLRDKELPTKKTKKDIVKEIIKEKTRQPRTINIIKGDKEIEIEIAYSNLVPKVSIEDMQDIPIETTQQLNKFVSEMDNEGLFNAFAFFNSTQFLQEVENNKSKIEPETKASIIVIEGEMKRRNLYDVYQDRLEDIRKGISYSQPSDIEAETETETETETEKDIQMENDYEEDMKENVDEDKIEDLELEDMKDEIRKEIDKIGNDEEEMEEEDIDESEKVYADGEEKLKSLDDKLEQTEEQLKIEIERETDLKKKHARMVLLNRVMGLKRIIADTIVSFECALNNFAKRKHFLNKYEQELKKAKENNKPLPKEPTKYKTPKSLKNKLILAWVSFLDYYLPDAPDKLLKQLPILMLVVAHLQLALDGILFDMDDD
jgi:hypothetical protein